jgi:hypothetical protein
MKYNLNSGLSLVLAVQLLLLLTPQQAAAQERFHQASKVNPRQVFAELVQPYHGLHDYTVKIQANVAMPNVRIPDFSAMLYFKRPDKFKITTKSFAPVPRGSAIFNPFRFDPEKNQITFKQMQNLNGVPSMLFKVEPGEEEKRIRFYHVWVGGNPKHIMQVESFAVSGTRALIKLTYRPAGQNDDKWLLPDKVDAHLTFPEGMDSSESLIAKNSPLSAGRTLIEPVTGKGNITISYSDWQINTGLDDLFFKQQ